MLLQYLFCFSLATENNSYELLINFYNANRDNIHPLMGHFFILK